VVSVTDKPGEVRERALKSLGQLPPFSPTLNRILATLAQEDVCFVKLGELVEKDTVVAGNVLHLVNSALYGRRETINSVRHAISILGINKLRNAVLGMSVARMWKTVKTPPGWSMRRFNMHSAAVAVLADLLAEVLPVDYPEGAFVAGLLHDVGKLVIAMGLPKEWAEVERLRKEEGMTAEEAERAVLGMTHSELSAAAMDHWKIPDPIRVAAAYHHRPEKDPGVPKPGMVPLSRVVWAANHHVNLNGDSVSSEVLAQETPPSNPLGYFELRDRLPRLLENFDSEFESMAAFFREAR
jgi:HD-like signal output (HDOD) protein